MSYNVLSPDGIPIHRTNTYETRHQAIKARDEWMKQFEKQGYYSSKNGRIDLHHLAVNCRIIQLTQKLK